MGAFKEIYTENYGEAYFQDLDANLEDLEFELQILDQQLEVIDQKCEAMAKEASALLIPMSEYRFRSFSL